MKLNQHSLITGGHHPATIKPPLSLGISHHFPIFPCFPIWKINQLGSHALPHIAAQLHGEAVGGGWSLGRDSYGRNGAENGHINKCIYIYREREGECIYTVNASKTRWWSWGAWPYIYIWGKIPWIWSYNADMIWTGKRENQWIGCYDGDIWWENPWIGGIWVLWKYIGI